MVYACVNQPKLEQSVGGDVIDPQLPRLGEIQLAHHVVGVVGVVRAMLHGDPVPLPGAVAGGRCVEVWIKPVDWTPRGEQISLLLLLCNVWMGVLTCVCAVEQVNGGGACAVQADLCQGPVLEGELCPIMEGLAPGRLRVGSETGEAGQRIRQASHQGEQKAKNDKECHHVG